MCPTRFRGPIRVSDFFTYRGGELHAEEVAVPQIATAVGTPFYIYSAAAFTAQYRRFAEAFSREQPLICYAVKANSNLAVLRLFAGLVAGADVVSEGELRRALAAGMPPQKIIFSGIGKARAELEAALDAGIYQINVESVPELRRLSEVASARGWVAPVAIRVNPDVDARTHAKISTGMKENKFGIDLGEAVAAYSLARDLPGIEPVGLAVHIGAPLRGSPVSLASCARTGSPLPASISAAVSGSATEASIPRSRAATPGWCGKFSARRGSP